MLTRYDVLVGVLLHVTWVEGQGTGGANVCTLTKQSYVAKEEYKSNCGILKWGVIKCTRERYVIRYKTVAIHNCCTGWTVSQQGATDCDIAICFGETGTCPNRGKCIAPDQCECATGFRGEKCSDVDECSVDNGGCEGTCENTVGFFKCGCKDGYELVDGTQCEPVCFDEPSGTCANNGKCLRPNVCECHAGFQLPQCNDVDECKDKNGGCAQVCENLPGSFMCKCNPGFEQSIQNNTDHCTPICFDIVPAGDCLNGGKCTAPGECQCKDGYQSPMCEDFDECAFGNHRCSQLCTNLVGTYQCSCEEGFKLQPDKASCLPVCFGEEDGVCGNNGTCILPEVCDCPPGFEDPNCRDINECQNGVCEQDCENSFGSYRCLCFPGYVKDSTGSCKAVCSDELPPGKCLNGGTCSMPGLCDCPDGFMEELCADSDECSVFNGGCSDICVNEHGGYHCECFEGYSLVDDWHCGDVDECQLVDTCDQYCINLRGSFTCQCKSGYLLTDELKCQDIDECESVQCEQGCENSPGSYKCICGENFFLKADGISCQEIRLCGPEDDPESGCDPRCTGRPCSCPDGRQLQGEHCIDPCAVVPCLNGGKCIADWFDGYRCDCWEAGYMGDNCETGTINMPSALNARAGQMYPNIYVDAKPQQEIVLSLSEKIDNVQIFPNPIIVKDPTNFKAMFSARGKYELTFNVTGTNADVFPDQMSVSVEANDVFSRLKLNNSALPSGCFWYIVNFQGYELRFTSTSPWYKLTTGDVVYTDGIVMIEKDSLELPISTDGIEIKVGTSFVLSSLRLTTGEGRRLENHKSIPCSKLFLSEKDMNEFSESRSILWSLFTNLHHILPYWMRMAPSLERPKEVIPFKPQILSSSGVQSQKVCNGAPTEDGVLYLVFVFKDPFSIRILEEVFKFPEGGFCIIVDMIRSMGPTVTFMFSEDVAGLFKHMDLFRSMEYMTSLELYFTGFSISLPGEIPVPDMSSLQLWNGANMFHYPFSDKATVWSTMVIKKDYQDSLELVDFKFAATIEAYLANIDPHTIFTHLFVSPRDVVVQLLNMELEMGLYIFGKRRHVKYLDLLKERRAVVAMGGDGERKYCGLEANPPGFFAHLSFEAKLFEDQPILNDFTLGGKAGLLVFKTFPEGSDKGAFSKEWDGSTASHLMNVSNSVESIKTLFSGLKMDELQSEEAISSILLLKSYLTDVTLLIDNVTSQNFSALSFANFVEKETQLVSKFDSEYSRLKDRLSLTLDSSLDNFFAHLNSEFKRLRKFSEKVVYQLYMGTIPFIPHSIGTWGFKGDFQLSILGMKFGIKGEFVLTDEDVMPCSGRFSEFYDDLEGERAVRLLGILSSRIPTAEMLPWGPLFWKVLSPTKGFGIEVAFAMKSIKFVARIHVQWSIFGVQTTGDLFVTTKGVFASVEANIWNMFRTRLTVGVELSDKPKDWALWLSGDFLAGGDDSFQGGLWDAVRKQVKQFGEAANKRILTAQGVLKAAQIKLSAAQEKVEASKQNLKAKEYVFDEAVAKLENAKQKLENAKAPFRNAQKKLTDLQNKLDSMCQIQTCKKICIPGVKLGKKKWFKCGINKCANKINEPRCVLKNFFCRIRRWLVFGALQSAKIFIHIPILALDGAKSAVSLAQIVVDKSRVLLDVAAGLYDGAKLFLKGIELSMGLAEQALDKIRTALAQGLLIFDAFVKNTLQAFLDIKSCGFKNTLSVSVGMSLEVYCEVNLKRTGWKKHFFVVDFRNIIGSLWKQAKEFFNKATASITKGRKKRHLEYETFSNFHRVFRRAVDNTSLTDTEQVLSTMRNFWKEQCNSYKPIVAFMRSSLQKLLNISIEISSNIEETEKNLTTGFNISDDLNNMAMDSQDDPQALAVLNEFNITQEQVSEAFQKTKFEEDEVGKEFLQSVSDMQSAEEESLTTVKKTEILTVWKQELESEDDLYDGLKECNSFSDCMVQSFGDMYALIDSIDPKLGESYRLMLPDFEAKFYDLLENESALVGDVEDRAQELLEKLKVVDASDIFCDEAPTITHHPNNTEALKGSTVTLSCVATSLTNLHYQWQKDSIEIPGANQSILKLVDVTSNDIASYSCTAENHIGTTTSNFATLEVVFAPKIESQLPGLINLPHEVGNLECKASGNPAPEVEWYTSESLHPVHLGNVLNLDHHGENSALLQCVAKNKLGYSESNEIHLRKGGIYPASPIIYMGIKFYRSSDVQTNALVVNGSNSLPGMFNEALRSVVKKDNITIGVASFDADNSKLNISLAYHIDINTKCRKEGCHEIFSNRTGHLIITLNRLLKFVADEMPLFIYKNQSFLLNPATVELDKERQLCQNGPPMDTYTCGYFPKFNLPPLTGLQVVQQNQTVELNWASPVYDRFIKGYQVKLRNKVDGTIVVFNSTSTKPYLLLNHSYVPTEYEVSLSAYTMALSSMEANKNFSFKSVVAAPQSSPTDSSTVGLVVGISVTLGVIIIALVVIGVVLYSSKSTKSVSMASLPLSVSSSQADSMISCDTDVSSQTRTVKNAWQHTDDGEPIREKSFTSSVCKF